MQPRREGTAGGRMPTRRRNRDTFFVFHTCYFICLGPGSLLFIFVSTGVFVVEISLVNERVACVAFVFHIPIDFQIPVHYVSYLSLRLFDFLYL